MKNKDVQLSKRAYSIVFLKAIGLTVAVMLLFYRSFWAIVWFPFLLVFALWQERGKEEEKKERRLRETFLHGITVLNVSLQAGFSMENAWKEVEREIKYLYGEESEFYQELKGINQRTAHNTPIEKLFMEFAYRCKLEEMIQFAELLEFGKRSGGNWKQIIDVTVAQMSERQEAKQEIEIMVAEKKMEQEIMNFLPLGILAFLQFSAWDYMAVLYHNLFGVMTMTIFLLSYVAAIVLSQKILKVSL
ncbi:MAG: hypothetical protein IKJ16_07155 [Agathobacter sp.]|nr:hypothetical protein [Agathobacter sp.]